MIDAQSKISSVEIDGTSFQRLTESQVVSHIRDKLQQARGGSIFTPNVDILRQMRRMRRRGGDAVLQNFTITVADGTPVVWASRLARRALPSRVAGSSLVWSLSEMAARYNYSILVVGAAPGVGDRAIHHLQKRFTSLRAERTISPPRGFLLEEPKRTELISQVKEANAGIIFVALGFPLQEQLMQLLATECPQAWILGCGGAIDIAAGVYPRAPLHLQQWGLEWLHRLRLEPIRLARRYLLLDFPYALRLMLWSLLVRFIQ